METEFIPKVWESMLNSSGFVPVIVKTIEKFHDASFSMEPNKHEHFELVYVKKGHAVFQISGHPVPIGPNDIVIIKPNQTHKLIVDSETGCEFIVLSFKFMDQRNSEFSETSLEDFLNFVRSKEDGSFIALKVSQKNEIINVMNRILRERERADIGNELLNYLLVMELFILISRALKMEWENSIKNKSPKIKELIHASVSFINNNFERDISVGDISKFVFLSTSYFTRAFKEEIGISPMNYLLKVRVDRAKELLEESELKISDIALQVGFSNQQRFNEMFKKYAGITPMQYRKQKRIES